MNSQATATPPAPLRFQTRPEDYRHWELTVEDDIATLRLSVAPDGGLHPGYELKLNSYDLGVDIELADALLRLRFVCLPPTCPDCVKLRHALQYNTISYNVLIYNLILVFCIF